MKRALGPTAFLDTFSTLLRHLRTVLAEKYGEAGIGTTQGKFVRHVARHGRVSQAELARATNTDAALTGRVLLGMLERGEVKRERSESDRREYLIELGPNGPELLARVERVRAKLAERLVRPLDARDVEDFDRIAKKMLAAFEADDED